MTATSESDSCPGDRRRLGCQDEHPVEGGSPSGSAAEIPLTRRDRPGIQLGFWKAVAFIKRDARIETSYKFQFLWSFATIFFSVVPSRIFSSLMSEAGKAPMVSVDFDATWL